MIEINDLVHVYHPGTELEVLASTLQCSVETVVASQRWQSI